MRKLVLCEKPSVARDLARALGVPTRGDGPYESGELIITWCIGHLVELAEPAAYSPAWRRWSFASLPMVPEPFQLQPIRQTARQWRVVRDLLRRRDLSAVVNACDAGREGELIFRNCYALAESRLPIERLWISSLTEQAIVRGMAGLRPGRDYDALAAAARCRAQADWLVGLNATRAVTLWRGRQTLLSLGRVQTPTLSMLVGRELEIDRFVSRDYFEVEAMLRPATGGGATGRFVARFAFGGRHRFAGQDAARAVVERDARVGQALVEQIEEKPVREPPPLLFDLGALQRTCNRRFGLSAQQTLAVAQSLYEKHKLITYPRTDSRYLSSDLVGQLPRLFAALSSSSTYAPFCGPLRAGTGAPRRVFADGKVRDHHAIIPTALDLTDDRLARLSGDEARVLDLIARRFIGAFYPDAEFRDTRVVLRVDAAGDGQAPPVRQEGGPDEYLSGAPPPPDRYHARGRVRLRAGWQDVAGFGEGAGDARGDGGEAAADGEPGSRRGRGKKSVAKSADRDATGGDAAGDVEDDGPPSQALPALTLGMRLAAQFDVVAKQTRPPPRYNEATLLSAMEGAGKQLSDDALREAMRDHGLGTPATRASIIETLLDRGYLQRRGKQLVPTALGRDLIASLPVPELASAELTGRWEARLARLARGEEASTQFMVDITAFVADLVGRIQHADPPSTPLPIAAAPEDGAAEGRRARGAGTRGARSSRASSGRRRGRAADDSAAEGGQTVRTRRARATSRSTQQVTARSSTRTANRAKGRSAARTGAATGGLDSGSEGVAAEPRRRASTAAKRDTTSIQPRRTARASTRGRRASEGETVPLSSSPATSVGSPLSASPSPVGSTQPGAAVMPPIPCPRCGRAGLVWGKQAWGCGQFRSCPLVVPFQLDGHRLTLADLRLLCGGSPLYVSDAGRSRSIRLLAGRDAAPFLVCN